jgi:hypothetical protein
MKLKKKKELFAQLQTLEDYRVDEGKIEFPLAEVIFMTLFCGHNLRSFSHDYGVF